MKKLLSSLALMAATSLPATQYMHVNLPNGKEYDVKIEKTDRVCHVDSDTAKYIKIVKKDSTYSLYPLDGANVTFDNEIAKVNEDVSGWYVLGKDGGGCKFDTVGLRAMYPDTADYKKALSKKYDDYFKCYRNTYFSDIEIWSYQNNANKYAVGLLEHLTDGKSNKIISPLSLQMAMALLANGADLDKSYDEVTELLGCKGIALDSLNDFYKRKLNYYSVKGRNRVKIGLVNACFLANGLAYGKNFLQNMEDFYGASINNVDFSQDSTYKKIDNWAAQNTDSLICELPIERDPNNIFVLGNALVFKSEWEQKFNEDHTKKDVFTNAVGEVVNVDKMQNTIEGVYAEGQNYKLVSLPFYENFVMDVILPDEGYTTNDVLPILDWSQPISYEYGSRSAIGVPDTIYEVKVLLPKFKVDNILDLNKCLRASGFDAAFKKPFGGITNLAIVKDVKQVTHLEIDEQGAKGAAVTIITGAGSAAYHFYKNVDFDVNRPFIVTIRNTDTNDLLFLGVINDPTK